MSIEISPRRQWAGSPRLQIEQFRELCRAYTSDPLDSPVELHAWSVSSYRDFWRTFLDWSGLAWEGSADEVCAGEDVERAVFFPDVRLNYAHNLLRILPDHDDDSPALTSVHAHGPAERFSRRELRIAVEHTAAALRDRGVDVGARVAVVAPNNADTVITCLALAALGATVATAAPDMGPTALVGRLEAIDPVLLVADVGRLGSGDQDPEAALTMLLTGLPTVELVLALGDGELPATQDIRTERLDPREPGARAHRMEDWVRLPFNHALWVMFSSGTTGPPKAMVHGAGGALLEHVKEHRLHGDLRPGDVLYFHTTTAWMMWNWQLSALAVGAEIVVFDGAVTGPETLWQLAADHGVTVFGTSPAYFQLCQDSDYRPGNVLDLSRVRAVLSTGAVLYDWQFHWFTDAVGPLPLQSISGGTDIVGCFVLGHPERPVDPGRCQSLSLALDVAAYDEDGKPVTGQVGDLVCRRPFPSRPLGFLRDPDGERFHQTYFGEHPGVWTHGDLIEIGADGSARMHGRSDGVLNIDGIRIGPAEIYQILRNLPEIDDALAVEQEHQGSARLLLLVVLRPGVTYDEALGRRIRSELRHEGSAAHVPQMIVPVAQLPVTHNGKRSERAARDAVNGRPTRNLASLRNPESLREVTAAVAATVAGPGDTVQEPAGDALTAAVSRVFSSVLEVPSVDPAANFFDLGGTSRQSMTVLRRLRFELRRSVPLDTFLGEPSVAGLVAALRSPEAETSQFELLRAGDDAEPPLYLIHGVYGDVDGYRNLAEHLTTRSAVYGIVGSLTDDSGSAKSIAQVAADHVRALHAAGASGAISLAGYSFGGLVAFEMARLMAAENRAPEHLVLLDVRPPSASLTSLQVQLRRTSRLVSLFLPFLADNTPLQAFRDRFRRTTLVADRAALRDGGDVYEAYRWARYDGRVTYLRAARRIPVLTNLLYAWRSVAPRLVVRDVPGNHQQLLDAEYASAVAREMSAALEACDLGARPGAPTAAPPARSRPRPAPRPVR